jgi:hypothetical protein
LLTWINEGHTGLEQFVVVHCRFLVESASKSGKDRKGGAIPGDYDEAKLLTSWITYFQVKSNFVHQLLQVQVARAKQ